VTKGPKRPLVGSKIKLKLSCFLLQFYHACDTSDLVYYCLVRYDILSFADFLGSISSFWVTMLVMARLPTSLRTFAQTVGVLGVAVGVEYDRHGLLVFALPAGLAAVIMFSSWVSLFFKEFYVVFILD